MGNPTVTKEDYSTRWQEQKSYYSKQSRINKRRYFVLQFIIVPGTVLVPIMLGISDIPKGVPTVLSAIVAIVTAIEKILHPGDLWHRYRETSEALKSEKALYEAGAGPYRNLEMSHRRFVERCEEIIKTETGGYFTVIMESSEKKGEGGPSGDQSP